MSKKSFASVDSTSSFFLSITIYDYDLFSLSVACNCFSASFHYLHAILITKSTKNPGMQFPQEKNSFPPQAYVPQPVRPVNEAQFQNRPMVFPQFVTTDLSRFQVQPPWRGLSPHTQPRQKQEALPPDLNIGFQSPGSPVKQSSNVMVDSQQPDLALQL